MNLQSILVIILLIVGFTAAIWFIAKNGGWNSEGGCNGNCASCFNRCENEKKDGE